jgi:predicted membrane protein
MTQQQIDKARIDALAAIDRAERNFRYALIGGCAVEVALLTALLLLSDFKQRTHVLLIIGFVGSYSVVLMGLVALGAHVSRVAQRILRAIHEG